MGPDSPSGDSTELDGESVHIKAHMEMSPSWLGGKDVASFEQLNRERMVLLCDLNNTKAKFELTLQTLRSILRLSNEAMWADILEQTEMLAENAEAAAGGIPQESLRANAVTHEEMRQAEMEREHLEEKVEAQAAHISRLRELLQRQQQLLDETTVVMETKHQQSRRQEETITALERKDQSQTDIIATQDSRIQSLEAKCERHLDEVKQQREVTGGKEDLLRVQAEKSDDLEGELQASRGDIAKRDAEIDRQRAIAETHQLQVKELQESLQRETEAYNRMRDQLQVYEAADRRKHAYSGRAGPGERAAAETPVSSDRRGDRLAIDDAASTSSAREEATAGRPQASPPPEQPSAEPSARGTRRTPLESEAAAAGQGQAPSSRKAASGASGGATSTSAASDRGDRGGGGGLPPKTQPRTMDDQERDAFLSHFPMASRTERQMRNRLEDHKKKSSAAKAQ